MRNPEDAAKDKRIEEMIDAQTDPVARGVCMILLRRIQQLENPLAIFAEGRPPPA